MRWGVDTAYLHSKWLVLWQTQADGLTLSVEGIEVDEGYDAQGASSRRIGELRELLEGKAGFAPARG